MKALITLANFSGRLRWRVCNRTSCNCGATRELEAMMAPGMPWTIPHPKFQIVSSCIQKKAVNKDVAFHRKSQARMFSRRDVT